MNMILHILKYMKKLNLFYPPLNNSFKRKNVEYLDYSFRNDSLNDITLNDEYEIAIKFLHEIKNYSKNNNIYEKYKKENNDIKKRSNECIRYIKKIF